MRFLALLVLAIGPALTLGCSPRSYFANRWNDSKDVFTATIGAGGGAKARVGPVHTGVIMNFGSLGLRGGCFGSSTGTESMDAEFLIAPFERENGIWSFGIEGVDYVKEHANGRGKNYAMAISRVPFVTTGMETGRNPAYWSQIEVVGGLIVTVRLGFNPGELLDFILGWVGVDIYKDDIELPEVITETQEPKPEPKQNGPPPSRPPEDLR